MLPGKRSLFCRSDRHAEKTDEYRLHAYRTLKMQGIATWPSPWPMMATRNVDVRGLNEAGKPYSNRLDFKLSGSPYRS